MVSSMVQGAGDTVSWNPICRRHAQDWELGEIEQFFKNLSGTHVDLDRDDRVKSYYGALSKRESRAFLWETIWKSKAPSRVAFFAWEAALEALLTGDNLRKRKKSYVNWCYMCKNDEETVNHLLLHCPVARVLWDYIFSLSKIAWVMPRTVEDMFCEWSFTTEKRRKMFGKFFLWQCAGVYGPNVIIEPSRTFS